MIRIIGDPVAQGSMIAMISRSTGRAIAVPSNKPGLKAWRSAIKSAAGGLEMVPAGVPVKVTCVFLLRRPVKVPPERMGQPSTYPDADKLARAAGDALTGVAYVDDGQVVEWHVTKRYCAPSELPGAQIWVERVVDPAAVQPSLLSDIA